MSAQIQFTGNIGKVYGTKQFQSGKTKASFSVGVNDGSKEKPHTTWFNCDWWDPMMDVQKGMRVVITGRFKSEDYRDKDGVAKSIMKVICETVNTIEKTNPKSALLSDHNVEQDVPF